MLFLFCDCGTDIVGFLIFSVHVAAAQLGHCDQLKRWPGNDAFLFKKWTVIQSQDGQWFRPCRWEVETNVMTFMECGGTRQLSGWELEMGGWAKTLCLRPRVRQYPDLNHERRQHNQTRGREQ
ncbi:hypothetical protein B0I35DRAFT_110801 [Stachybotrys elegans]|uniref:Uncharacterized protein n=1 Tax=Stachybotrys elegans TaxID=80388 RepID=A0A8K0SEL9_9HYPO|nr:hypothetical protein B0I35DRAFT_110801 [Stachybotrys elegans]